MGRVGGRVHLWMLFPCAWALCNALLECFPPKMDARVHSWHDFIHGTISFADAICLYLALCNALLQCHSRALEIPTARLHATGYDSTSQCLGHPTPRPANPRKSGFPIPCCGEVQCASAPPFTAGALFYLLIYASLCHLSFGDVGPGFCFTLRVVPLGTHLRMPPPYSAKNAHVPATFSKKCACARYIQQKNGSRPIHGGEERTTLSCVASSDMAG